VACCGHVYGGGERFLGCNNGHCHTLVPCPLEHIEALPVRGKVQGFEELDFDRLTLVVQHEARKA
jgi:hypothetical protein